MSQIRGKQIADGEITATQVDVTTGTNSTVNAGDAAANGSAAGLSRKDHQHAVATAAAGTIQPDDAAAEGSSSDLARADHTHAIVTAAPAAGIGASNAEGVATSFARSDHDHTILETGAQELTIGAIADGTLIIRSGTTLAGATSITDAQHGDLAIGDGLQHAAATASLNGFMSAADKTKLDALVTPDLISPKDAIKLMATADLATLSGSQTVDGVSTGTDGQRIGLFNQTTTTEDGIYTTAAGAWSRAADFDTGDAVAGATFAVQEGSTNGDTLQQITNNAGSDVVGTDDLSVAQIGSGSPRSAGEGMVLNGNALDVVANGDGSIVVNTNDIQVGVITEAQHGNLALNDGLQHAAATGSFNGFLTSSDFTKLSGITDGAEPNLTENQEDLDTEVITGADTAMTDTLTNTPSSGPNVKVYLNGVLQKQGATFDYTISGSTITWLASTGTAVDQDTTDEMLVVYYSA